LTLAVLKDDRKKVRELLEKGADVDENSGTEDEPITPIIFAISRHNPQMAITLINEGKADRKQDVFGYTLATYVHQVFPQDLSANELLSLLGDQE
jgi:hypothetical protein